MNVTSLNVMSKLVLPGMVERGRGALINISSVAGHMQCGGPMLAGYSGTKAYVEAFSKSIAYEVAASGVVVQTHIPSFVATKLAKIKRSSLMVPSPETWVAASLSMFGYGGTTVVPYLPHFIQDQIADCLPEFIAGAYVLSLHKDIQRRAIAKAAREAAGEQKAK